jgi:hypothetical protein
MDIKVSRDDGERILGTLKVNFNLTFSACGENTAESENKAENSES